MLDICYVKSGGASTARDGDVGPAHVPRAIRCAQAIVEGVRRLGLELRMGVPGEGRLYGVRA
jgi:hypothetical protein